jgi:fructose-1,6-bisphosphatase
LVGAKLKDQVNALISIFGPRTTAIYYNSVEKKIQELTAVEKSWIISHDHLTIKKNTNIFSPGNLRSASESE